MEKPKVYADCPSLSIEPPDPPAADLCDALTVEFVLADGTRWVVDAKTVNAIEIKASSQCLRALGAVAGFLFGWSLLAAAVLFLAWPYWSP